jgi:hypothetical protein
MRRGTNFLLLGVMLQITMAQSSGRMTRLEYFERYAGMAVHEMHRSGVPASITLAQGALESGDGQYIGPECNNHFGIKCHEDWTGKNHSDDDAGTSVQKVPLGGGFVRDHSDYLRPSRVMHFYLNWISQITRDGQRALKGPDATSPTYADALIKIIEDFNLYRYDKMNAGASLVQPSVDIMPKSGRTILENNRVKYKGNEGRLMNHSQLLMEKPTGACLQHARSSDSLTAGDIIYQPKRNKQLPVKTPIS